MRSFFRYPGVKYKLRGVIGNYIDNIDPLRQLPYREPFFGSGAIGLIEACKRTESGNQNIWINDYDEGIYCIWSAIVNNHKELINLVQGFYPTVISHTEINKSLKKNRGSYSEAEFALMKIASHQCSYSGLGVLAGPIGGKKQNSDKWNIDCRWYPDYICSRISDIHNCLTKIKPKITNLDFPELIQNDNDKSLIYLDPPYYTVGDSLYYCKFGDEHVRLCELLKKTGHNWILSYDDCPEIRKMYSWARINEVDIKYTIATEKIDKDSTSKYNSKARKRKELIITK